jgi:hypothetical protein
MFPRRVDCAIVLTFAILQVHLICAFREVTAHARTVILSALNSNVVY